MITESKQTVTDILTKIEIHKLSLTMNRERLEELDPSDPEWSKVFLNIEREERGLEELRKKYPEYFI